MMNLRSAAATGQGLRRCSSVAQALLLHAHASSSDFLSCRLARACSVLVGFLVQKLIKVSAVHVPPGLVALACLTALWRAQRSV